MDIATRAASTHGPCYFFIPCKILYTSLPRTPIFTKQSTKMHTLRRHLSLAPTLKMSNMRTIQLPNAVSATKLAHFSNQWQQKLRKTIENNFLKSKICNAFLFERRRRNFGEEFLYAFKRAQLTHDESGTEKQAQGKCIIAFVSFRRKISFQKHTPKHCLCVVKEKNARLLVYVGHLSQITISPKNNVGR